MHQTLLLLFHACFMFSGVDVMRAEKKLKTVIGVAIGSVSVSVAVESYA